jgi:hypothetical protein
MVTSVTGEQVFLSSENIQSALMFMNLVSWLRLLHLISTSFCTLLSGLRMRYHNFIVRVPVISR